MDISKAEQRVLHLLAQGGMIVAEKDNGKQIVDITCFTRDGWVYPGCSLSLFRKLKRRRTIASKGGGPYRITQLGLSRVRAQANNR